MDEDEYVVGKPRREDREQLFVVSGCSSGGKSTLLAEMARRGYTVFPEPGRQIVKEELFIGGDALPWQNGVKFAEHCISRAIYFYNIAQPQGRPVLFDRSMVDNIIGLQRLGLPVPQSFLNALERCRYAQRVFLTPPWPELFTLDNERKGSFAAAVVEYESLLVSYPALGYEVVLIPKLGVQERADFLEKQLRSYAHHDQS
jgi:predicted ATPase